jgi:hypothetical protein
VAEIPGRKRLAFSLLLLRRLVFYTAPEEMLDTCRFQES